MTESVRKAKVRWTLYLSPDVAQRLLEIAGRGNQSRFIEEAVREKLEKSK